MSAPDAHAATPAASPSPPARSSFVVQEGWLLVLSLVLAVGAWYVVRAQVEASVTLAVRVQFVEPVGCKVFAGDEVVLRLAGKKGEIEAVQQSLQVEGARLPLVVRALEPEVASRPIRQGEDLYRLPFPARLLEDPARPPLPAGEVVRMRRTAVAVAPPRLPGTLPAGWPAGVTIEVEVLTPTIEVLAPVDAVEGTLQPDALDLTPWRSSASGLGAPVEVTLGFEGWRGEGSERLRQRRAAVALPEVRARLRFVVRQAETLTGPISIVIKPGYVVTELLGAPGAAFANTQAEQGLGGRTQPTFSGEVRAPRELLERMRASSDLWRWTLRVQDADLPTEADATKRVTALLTLQAFDTLAERVAQGHIQSTPLSVAVEVRRLR